ncbi:ABC transporter permease [Salinarimonas soli]|uniref:ABC transporter permease n=1 Tax=Salinarimonas soli TaxID=1638099 RepID=A0A5B2VA04_9HYPH|nr:ABC transporter permease [Salinarimonas soli]KAA2235636.1 ABC transporter permease [Salinarimonas soli]
MKGRLDPQLVFLVLTNVGILAAGAWASGGVFIDPYNLQSMASQVPELGLLAIGVMLAMISGNGGIDLSGIALANLAGVTAALLVGGMISADDAPLLFSVAFGITAVAVGLAGGAVNGLLIAGSGLTPILCTLGTQLLFTGLAVVLSNGRAVSTGSPAPLEELGNGTFLQVPTSFLLFIAVAALIGMGLRFTPSGIRLLLMGTNPVAARFAGFAQGRMLVATYAISGALAGLAGVIIAARNVNVKWDYGGSYLLIAILIAVMAGVKPEGGHGRMICLLLSATALQLLSSFLNFLDVSNFFRDLAWGLLLLFFLAIIRYDALGALTSRIGWRARPEGAPAAGDAATKG